MSEAAGDHGDELSVLRARVAALEADRTTARPPHHRVRSLFAALLIVIGCVLVPLGIVASWTSSIVGDTDRYVQTVAPSPTTRTSRPPSPTGSPTPSCSTST
ncbi:hypothetical protein ACQ86F_19605 [Streptomyces venezuelae ATCC 10712]